MLPADAAALYATSLLDSVLSQAMHTDWGDIKVDPTKLLEG
jgi:hypothetical protein